MYRLRYEIGGTSQAVRLEKDTFTIGRMEGNDLVLTHSSISRHHAELARTQDGAFRIRDRGARFGVFVNGKRCQEARLSPGDVICLGPVNLVFELEDQERVRMESSGGQAGLPEGTIVRKVDDVRSLLSSAQGPAPAAGDPEAILRLARRSRILGVLAEVSSTLLAAADPGEVFEKIMDVTFQHVPARSGVLLLVDPATGELQPRAVRSAEPSAEAIQISRSIARKALQERLAILTQDAQADDRFQAEMSVHALGIRSALCVPLLVEEQVLGLIYVETPFHVRAYGEFDLELLTALAGYGAVAIRQADLRAHLQRERLAKSRLERYHSPSVVERILSSGESTGGVSPEVREIDATVLVADMVGFSTLTEDLPPREVAVLLNAFFSRMTDAIFRHEGTLDKYIGDAVMAVFGAPIESKDHAARAVRCAREMMTAMEEWNSDRTGHGDLAIRIGVNSGRVVAGDIGSVRRLEYSVLGNTVTLAFRLQTEVAEPGQIAVGEETVRACGDEFRFEAIRPIRVKGLTRPVTAYRVVA